jgi:hypothetical protein
MANCVFQKFRKGHSWLDSRAHIGELANGGAMPPVIVMMCGSLFSGLLVYLAEHGNAFIIFLAGAAALLALADISFGVPRSPRTGASPDVTAG